MREGWHLPDRYPTRARLNMHFRHSPQRRSTVSVKARNTSPARDRDAL